MGLSPFHAAKSLRGGFRAAGSDIGPPVYAAHAGTLYLKRYGTADWQIDMGFAARIVAEDGITSTIYGHLDIP